LLDHRFDSVFAGKCQHFPHHGAVADERALEGQFVDNKFGRIECHVGEPHHNQRPAFFHGFEYRFPPDISVGSTKHQIKGFVPAMESALFCCADELIGAECEGLVFF